MTTQIWAAIDYLAETDFALRCGNVALVSAPAESGLPAWSVYLLDDDGLPRDDVTALYEGDDLGRAWAIARLKAHETMES